MSMTVEALDFDPYRLWLNITESQRPLGPYQLLAVLPLEADANRIRAGYLRQQSAMLLQVEKADPVVWESISREIEEAYTLLCDPEQKAVVDAGIRRKIGGGPNGKPAAGPALPDLVERASAVFGAEPLAVDLSCPDVDPSALVRVMVPNAQRKEWLHRRPFLGGPRLARDDGKALNLEPHPYG